MCTEEVKIKLFVTYCSQFYCAQLWLFSIHDKCYKKSMLLIIMYSDFYCYFRDAQGRPCSASGMFVNRKVRSFQEILRNVIFKFRCRLDASQNELVKCTLFRNIINSSKRRSHWNRLLLPNREENG